MPGERHLTLWSYFWTALTRRYGSFSGRSRRLEFWSYYLFIVLFYLLILAAQALLDGVEVTTEALIASALRGSSPATATDPTLMHRCWCG